MSDNLLVLAAVAAVAFLLLKKGDPTHQPAVPGGAYQPPGPTTVNVIPTSGPIGTLTQELNAASTTISNVSTLAGGVADVFSRIGQGDDTEVLWPS